MAINKLNNFSTSDNNLEALMDTLTRGIRGKMDVSLDSLTTTTIPTITVGSVFECAGTLYKIETSAELITGSSAGKNYIYFNGTGFEASLLAPEWNPYKQGWYHPTNKPYRALHYTYEYDGASTYNRKIYDNFNYIIIEDATEISTTSTSWVFDTSFTFNLPVIKNDIWNLSFIYNPKLTAVRGKYTFEKISGESTFATMGRRLNNQTYIYDRHNNTSYLTTLGCKDALIIATKTENIGMQMAWRIPTGGGATAYVKDRKLIARRLINGY